MIPISLSLQNFLSYGEGVPPLDFTGFHVACISGRNGHGKSALLDAITWALWGEARKAGIDRRANDGLLRIGATEMQVDFEFQFEGDRYRISRSFRKTGRNATTRLELQVFSPADGGYKTLSEEGSIRKTQDSLNKLLRMTYDTFINSAFILQGRADEFTRRNARERKTILADILGLSRYDDLAQLARNHVQQAEGERRKQQIQLDEIETATAQKSALMARRTELDQERTEIEKAISDAETQLEALQETLTKRERFLAEKEALQENLDRINEELQETQAQYDATQKEVVTYQEILNQKDRILKEVEEYKALQTEESTYQQKLLDLRPLEQQKNDLEREIEKAKHEVERRYNEWHLRVKDTEKQIEDCQVQLQNQEDIEARIQALYKAREQDQAWDTLRENRDRIERDIRDLERKSEAEKSDLQVAINTRREQLRQQEKVAAELPNRQTALESAQQQLEAVKAISTQRDQIRDQGSALNAKIETGQHRLQSLKRECQEIEQQQQALQNVHTSQCPLCGTTLNEAHKKEVFQKLKLQVQTLQNDIQTVESDIQNTETQREQLRRHYQELKNKLADQESTARTHAEAEAAVQESQKAAAQTSELKQALEAHEQQLIAQTQNSPTTRALVAAQKELAALKYNPAEHRTLREKLKELETVEKSRAQIQAAKEQLEKAQNALPEFLEKRKLAQQWLNEKRYAAREQEALQTLLVKIQTLNYDLQHHQSLAKKRDQLKDAPTRVERLQVAQRDWEGAQQRLQTAQKRQKTLTDQKTNLTQHLPDLDKQIQEAHQAVEASKTLQETLRNSRQKRDHHMQQRATIQAQVERCETLEANRETIQTQLKKMDRDIQIHRHLITAFGKDGIQALIIEQAIPEIEEEANRILSRLTGNRTQIALESLRDLKKGGTRETLDIKISDEMGERSYELYSGGEAFRVDFAIRIALSKLLASRTGTRLSTLVIDEGFGTQDTEGLDHLVEAIQAISQDFEKILVITHVESLKQSFPVRVEVTKYPDQGSRFEVLY